MSERTLAMEPTNRTEPGTERADQGTQLRLLPGGPARDEWVLDSRTRAVGREGVARARQILAKARPPEPRDHFSKAS